ncbi:mediator of RNA polymerase ii transcription subunit 15-like protein [Plakobranchus ocellatus]|uniref:Mediator of RNA polymerase II transcription subunit 15 n=1 Tax=Plakobranchus ocellatus TaxID=259542 RepID=A0AAV3ZVC7_9GAST|nr:mediator of RNA polymerase ii transcription subunit 15-like protein [Plakobranchus ocellatus]
MAEPNRMTEDWPSPSFRANVVEQLEEARRNSQTQMIKSSVEMEDIVFQKARNKAEYVQFIHKVLSSVSSDHSKEKKMVGQPPQGMMPNMGQVGMTGMRQQGPVPGPDQDPINALQNLAGQGAAGMNRQQQQMGMMPGMQGMVNPQQQQQPQPRMEMMRPPHMQHARAQQIHGMHRPPQLARQDAFMVTSPQSMPVMPGQAIPTSSMGYQQAPGGPVRPMGPMGMAGQYMAGRDPNMIAMPMQGPNQGSPLQMMASPMTSHTGMMPSPVGARTQVGVPSPNQMLHTPGNVVTEPSPGPPSTSQEELEYVKKLEKLSRYIEPLRKFVQDAEKKTDEESIKSCKKMKKLLVILTDPKNRVRMEVLDKCEQALLKLNPFQPSSAHGHMCQPLLDVVARFSTAPSLNHSLYRTFGPALEAYTGPAIKAPSPPPSKKRKAEQDSPEELPDLIQGEIARLGRRFQVSVDPKYHPGSEAYHLVCRLEETRLPSVPPLLVKLPKTYPRSSPQCDPDACSGYVPCNSHVVISTLTREKIVGWSSDKKLRFVSGSNDHVLYRTARKLSKHSEFVERDEQRALSQPCLTEPAGRERRAEFMSCDHVNVKEVNPGKVSFTVPGPERLAVLLLSSISFPK